MAGVLKSDLWTDAYKPRMAQMGWPLRNEVATLTYRKGGPFLVGFDLKGWVQNLLQEMRPTALGAQYLTALGQPPSAAYLHALSMDLTIDAVPEGTWVLPNEPLLRLEGPSALWSHLEGALIGETSFLLQVLTCEGTVSTPTERDLATAAEKERGRSMFPLVDSEAAIQERATRLLELGLQPHQLAEGGLRSATCSEQHYLAVRACKAAGFTHTSNLHLASFLGMQPAGTTGHEHVQRYGGDLEAFRAAAERDPGIVTFLLDTFSTRHSGLEAACRVALEHPTRQFNVRPDCEPTQVGDFRVIVSTLQERKLVDRVGISLSGSFNLERTKQFLLMADQMGFPREKLSFLYGEHLLTPPFSAPTRSKIATVLKLSETGGRPTMKFSDGADGKPGPKSSWPGRPVLYRRRSMSGPYGLVAQQGEPVPEGYVNLFEAPPWSSTAPNLKEDLRVVPSPRTQALIDACMKERTTVITRALQDGT